LESALEELEALKRMIMESAIAKEASPVLAKFGDDVVEKATCVSSSEGGDDENEDDEVDLNRMDISDNK
jgi:hypothetical protein